MGKKLKPRDITEQKRVSILNEYMNMYKAMFLNRFEYKNLPQGMRQEYIEEVLFNEGKVCFFYDESFGYCVLPVSFENNPNIYGNYDSWRVLGYNYNKTYDIDNSVIIRNNRLMTSTNDYLYTQCQRLVDIDITIDCNINAQKTPYIVKVSDKDILTFKNIYKDIENGVPVIYADKGMNIKDIEVFPTLAPYVADKLNDEKKILHNEILTRLGINNNNIDKKERTLVDEVNANNEIIYNNLATFLDIRKENIDEVNKMFNLNITVELKEEKDNGSIHIDDKTTTRE